MATTSPEPQESVAERVAGGMLPRVLNTFDMVAIFVSIVLFITNAAVIQSAGPAAFGWWIIGFLAFLIPGAIVTGQLGRMFPGEGSIYLWTQKAFGPFWGFFAGFCAWWPGVLVMVATGTVVLSYLGYVFPSTIGAASVQVQGVIIIAFIVLSAVLANQRFRLTQNVVNAVCILYGIAIGLVVLAGIVHLAGGLSPETNPTDLSAWAPSSDTGINLANWSFFGVVVLALLGVEVPLNMGVEIKNERSITRYLVWGSLAVMLAYVLATWAVMVTVPAADGQSAQVTALATAVGTALTGWLGKLVAILFAAFFLFITVVYNFSFARLVFVSGLDQKLPSAMAKVNKHKVPSNAVWVQTVIASLFALVAFVVMPSMGVGGGKPIDIQTKAYDVLQAAVTVIWCISMVVLFVDVVIIIRRFLPRYEETKLARPAVFYTCAVIGGVSAFVAVIATLSGSWTPLITNDSGSLSIGGAQIAYGTLVLPRRRHSRGVARSSRSPSTTSAGPHRRGRRKALTRPSATGRSAGGRFELRPYGQRSRPCGRAGSQRSGLHASQRDAGDPVCCAGTRPRQIETGNARLRAGTPHEPLIRCGRNAIGGAAAVAQALLPSQRAGGLLECDRIAQPGNCPLRHRKQRIAELGLAACVGGAATPEIMACRCDAHHLQVGLPRAAQPRILRILQARRGDVRTADPQFAPRTRGVQSVDVIVAVHAPVVVADTLGAKVAVEHQIVDE